MKLTGAVVHGQGVGKEYGYPTANINKRVEDCALEMGIYVGRAFLGGQRYDAAIVAKNPHDYVEVYLIGYVGGEFYGQEIQVEIYEKIGEYTPIAQDIEQLKKKIERDLAAVQEYLKKM